MNNEIKQGDIVRLTDPINNGEVVRIESVNEHGSASWLGGAQKGDMEQIPCEFEAYPIGDNSLHNYYETLSDVISDLESKIGIKLYPESAVEYWKQRAEKAEESIVKSKDYIKKVCKESSDDIQKLDAENKKLKQELARCRTANADYLTAKTETENRAKLLEKEVADLKVPESRQNRHLRDELHKVRLECQQAFEAAEKERKENAKLRMEVKGYIGQLNKTAEAASYFNNRYEDIKRQLDESKQDILTLVNLIPCNEGNESIINDIKNLLK